MQPKEKRQMAMQMEKKGMRKKEIAEALGISAATIGRWMKKEKAEPDALQLGAEIIAIRLRRALEQERAREKGQETKEAEIPLKELIQAMNWLKESMPQEEGEKKKDCIVQLEGELKEWAE